MADGGATRCLSDLSDDLLQHILLLAPDKEGASTAVLSRRWRWLWRSSGVVFLNWRISPDQDRKGFLHGAEKDLATAAAAAGGHIRRLTLLIVEDWERNLMRQEDKLMEALVSNPAAQHVEELKLIVVTRFRFCFGSLPSEALRVLHLIGCYDLTAPPPSATEFPMLVELHLQRCDVFLVDFKKMINVAPRLSTLHLKSSTLHVEKDSRYYEVDDDDDDQLYTIDGDDEKLFGRLLLPAVTTLVVDDCHYGHKGLTSLSLELDVPRLQYFRYRGHIRTTNRLWLKSHVSSNMIEVDLDLTSNQDPGGDDDDPTIPHDSFLQFIQNFNTTKFFKLKLDFTKDHFALEVGQEDLLSGLSFDLLDQLELEAEYKPGFERPLVVMLENLLHSCPMVCNLRLKLRKQHETQWVQSSIDKEARLHFDRSVNGFRNRSRPMLSLGGEDDPNYSPAFSIIVPCLTGEHSCLQSHVKTVSLQFFMDEPNCLGVQLAKFFAENAMVLQEIHVDDGCHEMLEHVNPTVRRWIAKTDTISNKELNVKD